MIIIKRPYMHFKGGLYYVHDLVEHAETGETLVSYQALYPPYKMYVRPLEIFLDKVDLNNSDNITNQTHRFELYKGKESFVNANRYDLSLLRFPEGSFIKWNGEYYKVIENDSDFKATVMDMTGNKIKPFYFSIEYSGDLQSSLIKDESKIQELEQYLSSNIKKCCRMQNILAKP